MRLFLRSRLRPWHIALSRKRELENFVFEETPVQSVIAILQ